MTTDAASTSRKRKSLTPTEHRGSTQESLPKKRKKRREKKDLIYPSVCFNQEIASILWMPQKADLVAVRKHSDDLAKKTSTLTSTEATKARQETGKRHERRTPAFVRDRVPESQRVLKPLLTSCTSLYEIAEDLQALDITEDETANIRCSCLRKDRATRLTSRDEAKKMTMKAFGLKYGPISKLGTIGEYFRTREDLSGTKKFRMKFTTKSSIAGFFAVLKRDEKTTYPDMKFKSKFAPSNSIEIPRDISRDHFSRGASRANDVCSSATFVRGRVLHQRSATAYVPESKSNRVCAIDPGVVNFATVYDPDGWTFSCSEEEVRAVDAMKSILALKDNACKENIWTKYERRRRRAEEFEERGAPFSLSSSQTYALHVTEGFPLRERHAPNVVLLAFGELPHRTSALVPNSRDGAETFEGGGIRRHARDSFGGRQRGN
ncbi:hypothetical protein GQ600_13097 [Phytophthora cactorum]|nr:hypothetical protein GQ600_13097 [Phytophthora cactorum]